MAFRPVTPNGVDVYASRRKWKNPSTTKTYYAWRSMRQRCTNPKHADWHNYGGRGIRVCDRWVNDYDAFFDDMGPAPEGMTLERIDVEKGYSPANCRWATAAEQAINKRTNHTITHDGKTMTVCQWADHLGIPRDTLCRRLAVYKMPVARALTPESLVPVTRCGTRHGYAKGCRCELCKAAHAAHHREMRAKRKARAEQARRAVDAAGYLACGAEVAGVGA